MADPHGFQNVARNEPAHRPVLLRLMDWNEPYEDFPANELHDQASRCMDCGIPFCHEGCPLGNIIPEFNTLAWQGRWKEAFDRLHATNNFPEFTGRLCPAPCEGSCVLGISRDPVTIKQVELTIVEKGFEEGYVEPINPVFDTQMTVAVVGSGPAGLAAAQQLTRAGHRVTVFEKSDRIGGLMRYGVPEYKMEKKWIDRRLEQMRAEGTEFVTGKDVHAKDVARFDAVVLATGTPVPHDLNIEGRELDGIYQALEYLPAQNKTNEGDFETSPINAKGKRVVVIGGGDTGTDCYGTAIRQGAASVMQIDIMPAPPKERAASTPWPMYPKMWRVATAHEEGEYVITGEESPEVKERLNLAARQVGDTLGERDFDMNTVAFEGEDGQLTAMRGSKVEFVGGRFQPVEGTEFHWPVDMVVMAMGFRGSANAGLIEELALQVDERGRVRRDDHYRAITKKVNNAGPKVYVAGDAGRGQSLIVWAIAEGRSAAAAVDRDLMGETSLPAPVAPTKVAIGLA